MTTADRKPLAPPPSKQPLIIRSSTLTVHTNDFTPDLEDYIANYGGAKLVDELRKAESSRLNSKSGGKDWDQQTPEERQYNCTKLQYPVRVPLYAQSPPEFTLEHEGWAKPNQGFHSPPRRAIMVG